MTDNTHDRDLKYKASADDVVEHPYESPLHIVRRVLRGRLRVAGILALALAALGGAIGYRAVPPSFKSTGLVVIEGALPSILYEIQENSVPPMFDAYVAQQVMYLRGRPVLDKAVARPEMTKAGWQAGPRGVIALQRALEVHRGRGEKVISVSVTHPDPALAQTAVNAVLNSFRETAGDPGNDMLAEKKATLAARELELQRELHELHQQLLEASDQNGAEAIDQLYATKVDELEAVNAKLAEVDFARQRLEAGDGVGAGRVALLAGSTADLTDLESRELALLAEIKSLRSKFSVDHPMIRDLTRRLEAIRIQVDLRERALAGLDVDTDPSLLNEEARTEATRSRLSEVAARYISLRSGIQVEAARLEQQRAELAGIGQRITNVEDRLMATRTRLDQLDVETDRDMNRILIAAYGDVPAAPVRDRRAGLAAAGGMFGSAAGVGIIFLFGFLNARARFVEELEALDPSTEVVGLLPDLDAGGDDAADRSARSVHQLRNLLELRSGGSPENVYAITSCDYGEGKTSVTVALGTSFAVAGRRTLLIDADIARPTLSREYGLDDAAGLREAVDPSGNGAEQIHATGHGNLWVMPIGKPEALEPEDLCRNKLLGLFSALRGQFDVILVDTGPVLTSAEVSLVSAVSNHVILVVERTQRLSLIRSSIGQLDQVGAPEISMVFNRAPSVDFRGREVAEHETGRRIATLVPIPSNTGVVDTAPPLSLAIDGDEAPLQMDQSWKNAA